jgi:glyoxylase-like metal-dependent hydrolase (beta-lactamase superfamily II)
MNQIYNIITAAFVKINHVDPVETGKITDNLFVIRTGTANFFTYKIEEDIICFDSGFGKNMIISELNKVGIDPESITHLFLTHSDFDHANGASLFEKAKYTYPLMKSK